MLHQKDMNRKLIFSFIAVVLAAMTVLQNACTKDAGEPPKKVSLSFCDSLNVKYSTEIKPIMLTYCATSSSCHSAGSPYGDFSAYPDLQFYANDGELRDRVLVQQDMPQGGPPLSAADKQKIDCWLQKGFPNN